MLLLVIKYLRRQADWNFDSIEKISDISFLMFFLLTLAAESFSFDTILQ